METVELEREYRAACQKMLVSLDLRSSLNRMNEEIAKLHLLLTAEGSKIVADPSNEEALQSYKKMVHNVVAKLDERDQVRKRDGFKEALQDLLQLGEQLGFARKAEPGRVESVSSAVPKADAVHPAPKAETEEPTGFSAVEKELAELQNQLLHYQGGVQQPA